MHVTVSYSSSLMTGNPWTPKSDQDRISPYNSDAKSRKLVMFLAFKDIFLTEKKHWAELLRTLRNSFSLWKI